MQKPSIGRVVHYCHSGLRIPAMIKRVNSDTNVDLTLQIGGAPEMSSCSYAEESPESAAKLNNMDTSHGTWAWPPRI